MTAPAIEHLEIRPQAGPQEQYLASSADIVIGGGAAGGGKTWGLVVEPIRHQDNGEFGAVIFRKLSTHITAQGGLWDESASIYPYFGAVPNQVSLSWRFPSGAKVRFAHMQYANDRFNWDGSQIPLIGFDQLEHFEEIKFWYMLSRNRTTCGVRPYIRATCNPVPDDDPVGGWLHRLIRWWIDEKTGYPIATRAGVIRWFVRINEELHWADSPGALVRRFPAIPADRLQPKSLTFIPSTLSDNPILRTQNPGYEASLLAMPYVERERLLGGNWNVKPLSGMVFNRGWFEIVDAMPAQARRCRYWDNAGTQDGGKYTAGARVSIAPDDVVYIEDMVRGQWSAQNRDRVVKQTAKADERAVGQIDIWIEQEPGSAGKDVVEAAIRTLLKGYRARADKVTGDKLTRAGPLASQAEVKNVKLVRGEWNEAFLREAHAYEPKAAFKDQIDAASGAYNKLALSQETASGLPIGVGQRESPWF